MALIIDHGREHFSLKAGIDAGANGLAAVIGGFVGVAFSSCFLLIEAGDAAGIAEAGAAARSAAAAKSAGTASAAAAATGSAAAAEATCGGCARRAAAGGCCGLCGSGSGTAASTPA